MMIRWQLVEKYLIWLVLLVTPFLVHQFGQVECCLEDERLALLDLKAYMNLYNSNPRYSKISWSNPREINCCNWSEVRCNVSTGRVTKLILNSKVARDDEDAMRKPWLFNVTLFRPFSQLIYLDLSNNSINGLVENHGSTHISTLKNLRVLYLGTNNLGSGHISVSDLTSLRKLGLSYASLNESSFPLYQELSNLWKLQLLDLVSNYFSSDIQGSWLCRLRNLQKLDLSGNNFKGGIPPCINNLTSLQTLGLSFNNFSKEIPDLSNLKSLQFLGLSYNNFEGKFPVHSLANHSKLFHLGLSGNKLLQVQTEDVLWTPTFQLQSLLFRDCRLNEPLGTIPKFLSYQYNLSEIILDSNNLVGPFPTWLLTNNPHLQILTLHKNSLTGNLQLPHNLKPLYDLITLMISNNKFSGELPKTIGFVLPNLEDFYLKGNAFVGQIPSSIGRMTNLETLDLSYNNFSGELPRKMLSNLRSLITLELSNNKFSGELPKTIGFVLPNLEDFYLKGNAFVGQIPSSIGRMTNLETLDLSYNNFSGELPRKMLSNLRSLITLELSNNNLRGDVIPDHMNLPSLSWLKLSNNNFGGKIKDVLINSSSLQIFDISNNKVSGRLPNWIGNFSELTVLSVSSNVLQGHIPTELSKLGLQYLDLSDNNFIGKIIPSFYNHSSLRYLNLGKSNLRGSIPDVLSNFSQLITLDLADNHLTGNIPRWMSKFSNLRVLQLSGNQLQGQLPLQLCELFDINILEISHNNLFGEVPPCFENMSFGKRSITSENDDIQEEVTILVKNEYLTYTGGVTILVKNEYLTYTGGNKLIMSALDLSCNKLTGLIPSELGGLEHIHSFNLSYNNLSGPIPGSFSNLKNIESLDLSFNNLSGNIPSQLVELNTLEIFNVSYNNLTGRVPVSGQFGGFDESNYRGNPGLFGFPGSDLHNQTLVMPPSSLTKDGGDGDHDENFVEDFLWSFGMSCATIFLATIAILHINPHWRQACFDFVDWYILWWLPMSVRSLY